MSDVKTALIRRALQKFKKIYPCGTKGSFEECFTIERNKLVFWFNTDDDSTHAVAENLAQQFAVDA